MIVWRSGSASCWAVKSRLKRKSASFGLLNYSTHHMRVPSQHPPTPMPTDSISSTSVQWILHLCNLGNNT